MASKEGKVFEESIEASCNSSKPPIFFDRIKDVFVPPDLRARIRVPKNKYDCYIFDKSLFPLELKSTKTKSFSFDESIIKQHQIDNLLKASTYENVIAGFIFNFREPVNLAYFVHIEDFKKYQDVANGIIEWKYKSKINKSSIPLAICQEIGLEIKSTLKKVNYKYDIKQFIEEAIKRNHARLWIKGETN